MSKRKVHRSRCINPTCGKQFRHADPSAKTCSSACRQAVCRARRKEEAELEAARQEAEQVAKWERIKLEVRRQHAERQAAAREAEQGAVDDLDHPPLPPRRKPKRKLCLSGFCGICDRCLRPFAYETEPQKIKIIMRPHYPMTPLNRGR